MVIAMRVLIIYLISALLSSSLVFSLSSCNSTRKYLEVKEGRSDNDITCTGLTARETVRWYFHNNISFCSPSPSSGFSRCSTRFKEYVNSSTTFLRIDASEISDPNYIGTGTLTCEASTSISCHLDSVYPAENSSCQAQFQDNKVTAWCSVSKVRSARNNYVCSLYQALQASQATLVGSYTMNVVSASSGYFSGTCNMTSYLPPEGRYSYYVIIMPGEVNVSAIFIGNSIISRPRGIPYHNCPQYLNEGDTLNCSCFVNDLGNPPGVLRWNGTDSNKLEFENLRKSQNGIQSVCSLTWNNTVHQSVSYTLLVDYPAESSSCQVQFKDNKVTAWCTVSKVWSSRNDYRCSLYQALEASQARLVGSYTMDEMQASSGYFSGMCNMTSYLPPEGQYSYYVTIMPGEVNVSATFIGSSIISRPHSTPNHNCPPHLNEGDTLNCSCFVNDLGNPPGVLQWNGTDTNKLEFKNLTKLQNGIQNVCSLTWNNTVHQSASYTLLVAYQPTWISFTINTEKSHNVFVHERSTVTMKCQSDGRPAPRMTITKVRDTRILKSRPMGSIIKEDQIGEITYTTTAQCSDADMYMCTVANSLGMKNQSVSLSVRCKPRRASASCTTPIILEGKTSSFELIAYPNSVTVTKYFIDSNNNNMETPASDDIFRVDCTPNSQLLYKVTCTVTVIKVTVNTAGLYKAVVSNDLGSVALIFVALPTKINESENSEFNRGHKAGVGTGLGVGLGLAAVEAVALTTFFLVRWWRRKHHTSKAKGKRENTPSSSRQDISFDKAMELTESAGLEHESTYENVGNSEAVQMAIYTNVEITNLTSKKTSKNTGKVYDDLQFKDVGVRSLYASLTTTNAGKSYH